MLLFVIIEIMIIGIPKEIKEDEYRVSITPQGVRTLIGEGHKVIVERGAGNGSGFSDKDYKGAGARFIDNHEEVFRQADLIVKVKEPLPQEYPLLKEGLILFTFLHLAPNPELTKVLIRNGVTAIGYETIESEDGSLPILTPMSEIAGRLSVQIGSCLLHRNNGGRGILLGGVPGVEHGRVTIIGGGTVGFNAAKIAAALGAHVTVLDIDIKRLEFIEDIFRGEVETLISESSNIERQVLQSDLVIGAVLLKGGRAPIVIKRELVKKMKKGAVIVDVAIDQGGCVETSRPTTHSNPIFEAFGIIHYCVANIPGIVPRTSTIALTNLTLPYIRRLAGLNLRECLLKDKGFGKGVNVYKGKVTHGKLADALNMEYTPLESLL